MALNTITQVYLLPADSQAINSALATLQALGLKYELSETHFRNGDTLMPIEVEMPVIPVVHHYGLYEVLQEILNKRKERADRPSHSQAQSWAYGPITSAYPDAFFSHAAQQQIAHDLSELVVREHILQHFLDKGISVSKITFNKAPNEALNAPRFFGNNDWYAFVEEARPAIPNLAKLLGAIS